MGQYGGSGWLLGVISDKYARGLPDRPVIKVAFVKCEKQGLIRYLIDDTALLVWNEHCRNSVGCFVFYFRVK